VVAGLRWTVELFSVEGRSISEEVHSTAMEASVHRRPTTLRNIKRGLRFSGLLEAIMNADGVGHRPVLHIIVKVRRRDVHAIFEHDQ